MKKVMLTQEQTKKLMDKILNEQVPAIRNSEYTIDDGRYHTKCEFDFDYDYNELITYKQGQIDNISLGTGDVSFMIDIQYETYGIKEINVTDIKGPKSIKAKIKYYPEGTSGNDENWWQVRKEEEIMIPLDWSKIQIDDGGYGIKHIGIYKQIDVLVLPDANGGLRGGKMEIGIRNFNGED